MNLFIFFLFALLGTVCGEHLFETSDLKSVFVIAHHGSEPPNVTFPLDKYPPNDPKYWPNGPGSLTEVGKTQMFNIGVNLRRDYDYLLSIFYKAKEKGQISFNIYGRDLKKAEYLAAGLSPSLDHPIWKLLLEPVLIWPNIIDVEDVTSGGICSRFDSIQKEAYAQAYKDIYLPNKEFMNLVERLTGRKFTSVEGIKDIYDALEIQKENGLTLPDWATPDFRAKLADVTRKTYKVHNAGSPDMLRLTAGPVLKEFVKEIEHRSGPRIAVLLSSDNALFTIGQALGFSDFDIPQSAAYMVFEIRGSPGSPFDVLQVKYFKNSSSTTKPVRLDIPTCSHPCNLNEFINLSKKFIPDDWKKECGIIGNRTLSSAIKVNTPTIATLLLFVSASLYWL